jgi:hypothetical protein
VQNYEAMYSDSASSRFGRNRDASGDWQMFGFYVMHNIGIGFRCFAAGIFAGVGSAFVLVLQRRADRRRRRLPDRSGPRHNFCSFVITHSAPLS